MIKFGVNRDDIKKKNRGLILKLIATGQCGSRIELAAKSGLTKTAISQITEELIARGFLMETKKQKGTELGRKPMGLDISVKAPLLVGILIERGYAEAVLCDIKMNIKKYKREDREWYTEEELMDTVYRLADDMLAGGQSVAGIGVAAIGPVNAIEGKIVDPAFFHGIRNVEIRRLLTEKYGLPVRVDHDNQSAALAERLFGNGRDSRDLLLLGINVGVGSGIIVQDERYQCGSGYAPEIGHVSVDYRGNRCYCGNRGCLETYVRTEAVLKRLQSATGLDYDYRTFCAHAEDPRADEIFCDVVDKLCTAIISVLNMINSDMIILTMDWLWWPDKYLRMLEEGINRGKYNNRDVRTRVTKPYFMDKVQVLGAACNAVDMLFQGDSWI